MNIIAAALFCRPEAYILKFQAKLNGYKPGHDATCENKDSADGNVGQKEDGHLRVTTSDMVASQIYLEDVLEQANCSNSPLTLR